MKKIMVLLLLIVGCAKQPEYEEKVIIEKAVVINVTNELLTIGVSMQDAPDMISQIKFSLNGANIVSFPIDANIQFKIGDKIMIESRVILHYEINKSCKPGDSTYIIYEKEYVESHIQDTDIIVPLI